MVPAGYTEEEVERAQIAALAKIRELKPKMCVAGVCKSTPCWCMREVICAALSTLPTREAMRAEIERLKALVDRIIEDGVECERLREAAERKLAEALEAQRRCGICGGLVDLRNAEKPTATFGPGNKSGFKARNALSPSPEEKGG